MDSMYLIELVAIAILLIRITYTVFFDSIRDLNVRSPVLYSDSIQELGDLVMTFRNYSPWRKWCSMIVILLGSAWCGGSVIGLTEDQYHFQIWVFSFTVGITLVPHAVLVGRIARFELYERGFALWERRSISLLAYYSEISSIDYRRRSLGGCTSIKALIITLRDGREFELDKSFPGLNNIEDEIKRIREIYCVSRNLS